MINPTNLPFEHYIHRSNWLRAAVLGANDGIISIASLAVGIASAGTERSDILLATVAGLVAGALSMAAGEYVSVSAQTDIEQADIEREKVELATMVALLVLGYASARVGGSSPAKAMGRILIWGSLAMGASALVGQLFGVTL